MSVTVIMFKATIDLAYPSNRFMFGYMIDDTPMLFVKKAGADVTMLNGHFEQGSFTLKDWNEWGFRVTTDKLGKLYFIDFYGSESHNHYDLVSDPYRLKAIVYRKTLLQAIEKRKGVKLKR